MKNTPPLPSKEYIDRKKQELNDLYDKLTPKPASESSESKELPKSLQAVIKYMLYDCPFNRGLKECLDIAIKNNNGIMATEIANIISRQTSYGFHYVMNNLTKISEL